MSNSSRESRRVHFVELFKRGCSVGRFDGCFAMAAAAAGDAVVDLALRKLQTMAGDYQHKLFLSDEKERRVRDHAFGEFNFANERCEIQRAMMSLQATTDTCNSWEDIVNLISSVVKKKKKKLGEPTAFHAMLTRCIDLVKNASSDMSLKGVVNKLETISQDIGLQFDSGHTGTHCFISSDMFYVEVQLDSTADVLDVKVQGHSGDPKSSQELHQVLKDRDYKQFKTHLDGFARLYRLQGNAIIKSKILTSLEVLEADVEALSKFGKVSSNPRETIQGGDVGHVMRRQGGYLMQLVYCADAVALLNRDREEAEMRPHDAPFPRDLGDSVCVSVESSELRQLPSIQIVSKSDTNTIQYAKLDSNNSEELPASFCLLSNKQLPMALQLAAELNCIVGGAGEFGCRTTYPLDELIIRQRNLATRDMHLSGGASFAVSLPDQRHEYHWIPSTAASCCGLLLSRVQFQHPRQVPRIVQVLRRQALFNTLLRSCFRENEAANSHVPRHRFEVVMTSFNCLSVVFRHPLHGSLGTVEFAVQDDCSVTAALRVFTGAPLFCTNSWISCVVQRCLSVPITMRYIVKKALSFVPGSIPDVASSRSLRRMEKKSMKLDRLKLSLGSHFSAHDTGSLPLVSPDVFSAVHADSLRGSSPSGSALAFNYADLLSSSDSAAESPSRADVSGKHQQRRNPDEKKLKPLPKITLKRKRDRNEYEIDKEKSTLDDLVPNDMTTTDTNDNEADNDTMSFVYSEFSGGAMADAGPGPGSGGKSVTLAKELDLAFSNATLPFEIPMDALSRNTMDGDLGGLVLEQGIDPVSFMGGVMPGALALQGSSVGHLEPFDLDNIASDGTPLEFDVDDSLNAVPTSMIDPSVVVSTTANLGLHFDRRMDVGDFMFESITDDPLDDII